MVGEAFVGGMLSAKASDPKVPKSLAEQLQQLYAVQLTAMMRGHDIKSPLRLTWAAWHLTA